MGPEQTTLSGEITDIVAHRVVIPNPCRAGIRDAVLTPPVRS